jgi:hypothetical protein
MSKEIVIYFNNGRMVRAPQDKVVFVRLGERSDADYEPDTADGKATVNWDNVCFVREWLEPEAIDP